MYDALRNLVPLVQFEKREKHLWKSVTFSEVADFRLQMVPNRAKPLILEWFAVNFELKRDLFLEILICIEIWNCSGKALV